MNCSLLNCCIKHERDEESLISNIGKLREKPKIPRPPNAFMIYANENRKIMAHQYPADSNKEISKKLGTTWKKLDAEQKNKYFDKAKEIDMEHKRKYPNYVYNPKEARIRKAMREATRERSIGAPSMLPRPNARRPPPHPWMAPSHEEQLMMPPLGGGLRGPPGLDSPCFPNGNVPEQYMPPPMPTPTPNYPSSKMEPSLSQSSTQVLSPSGSSVHHGAGYMQPNPLAQLQQQTEMWSGFQDDLRSRSSGHPYMLQDVPPPHHYHHQPSPPLSIPSPMMMDKHRQTPHPMMPLNNPATMSLTNPSSMPLNNSSPMPLNNASPMSLNNASPMALNNASPMPLNNASPMPLNNASPMPLNNASPMPLNNASPMPLTNASPMPLNNASPMPLTPPNSNLNLLLTPPHSNENVPPDETLQPQTILDKVISEEGDIDSKQVMEPAIQPLVENNSVHHQMAQEHFQHQSGGYIPLYGSEMQITQKEFDKAQETKPRKLTNRSFTSCRTCAKIYTQKNSNTIFLPLSCTNFCASSELFTNNLEYQRGYISKYFENGSNYDVLNFVSEDGDTFPYATLTNFVDKDIFLNDSPQPNFIRTDVGYIPILFDNCRNITNVHKLKSQNVMKKS